MLIYSAVVLGSANYYHWAKNSLPPIFVMKLYWNIATLISWHIVYSCFLTTAA